eukprot:CAMPEP_0170510470 /NCGR_PEP_ID=MMETSP0208-20121228/65782_1 /TAXON_ID=197538 /ORGANISM="Strombidium inclinatum, Strain S3" /LENGTH=94 /DNA_ID=CAMNT_0010793935 /DNA_START=2390 /DNA_END=2674 /DNA_ORIENTATION=+
MNFDKKAKDIYKEYSKYLTKLSSEKKPSQGGNRQPVLGSSKNVLKKKAVAPACDDVFDDSLFSLPESRKEITKKMNDADMVKRITKDIKAHVRE